MEDTLTKEDITRILSDIQSIKSINWALLKEKMKSGTKATAMLEFLQKNNFIEFSDDDEEMAVNLNLIQQYLKTREIPTPKEKEGIKKVQNKHTDNMLVNALKIFDWEGRICRRQYFMVMFFFAVIAWVIARSSPSVGVSMSASVVLEVFKTPTYIKRLHDMNKSGRLIFLVFILSLIPIVNIGVGLILLFSPGTHGPNEYGEDPRKEKRFPHEAGNSVTEKREPINISKTAYPNLTSCGYTRNTSQQAYPEECPTWISPASWWIAGIIGIISSIGMTAESRGDNIQTGEKFLIFLCVLLVGTLVWKWISYVALFVIFLSWEKIKKWTSIVTPKINILFDSGVASIAQKVTSAVQAGKAHAEVKLEKQKLKERANDLELQRLQQRVADLEKELNNTSSRR